MSRTTRRTPALLAGALALTLAATALGGPPAGATDSAASGSTLSASVSGSIHVSPAAYVGGQAVTFTGRLGSSRRAIRLQQYMGRPGDIWFPVPGYAGYTASDGTFRVKVPAPDMWGVRYRVVSGSLATPAALMNAKVQAADLWVSGLVPTDRSQAATPVAGVPFGVTVDTTPDILGRTYALGTPVLGGRHLTLQKRVSPISWRTVAQTTERSTGFGYFTGVTEPDPGTVVYRVRQEALTTNGNRIGWTTSFPTYVDVTGLGSTAQRPPTPSTARYDAWQPLAASGSTLSPTMKSSFSTYGWGKRLFDFGWERGQSLSDAPDPGTGHWYEYSDGSGRAGKLNGMLALEARRENHAGDGDLGTTMATMVGNARSYGRWEVRTYQRSPDTTGRDYDMRVELVPAAASQYACGARNILVGQVRAHTSTLTIGAKNGSRNWSLTRRLANTDGYPSFAVEVEPGHITWFYAGVPIGTVKSSYAVSDVPLTLRLSLVGRGDDEMNQTVSGSDWQRGYAPNTGRQVLTGAALKYGAQTHRCDS